MAIRRNKLTEIQPALAAGELDINGLEKWLWDAACSMRGAVDAPKFKDYILPDET